MKYEDIIQSRYEKALSKLCEEDQHELCWKVSFWAEYGVHLDVSEHLRPVFDALIEHIQRDDVIPVRRSFVFYPIVKDSIRHLEDDDRLAMYDAIVDYEIDGIEPSFDGAMKAVFVVATETIHHGGMLECE